MRASSYSQEIAAKSQKISKYKILISYMLHVMLSTTAKPPFFRLVEISQKNQNSRSITLSYFPVIFRSPLANEWLSALIFFCAAPPPLPAAAAQVFYRVWLAEDPNTISLSGLSAPQLLFL